MSRAIEGAEVNLGGEIPQPFFSVIMPAYNSELYLAAAIDSVLEQEFAEWELLIVDDGSTDRTLAIALQYAENNRRIRVFTQENAGTAAARNRALEQASAPWALMLDSDDMLLPECMGTYERFLRDHPGYAFYSCNGLILYPSGRTHKAHRERWRRRAWSANLGDCMSGSPVMLPGSLVATEIVLALGGFAEGVYNEDHELWIRLLASGASHLYCPDVLVVHRQVPTSKTKSYARTAASSLAVVSALGAERACALGVYREWLSGIRAYESAAIVGEAQEMVAEGRQSAAVQRLWRDRKSVIWNSRNLARLSAMLLTPRLYVKWLERSK